MAKPPPPKKNSETKDAAKTFVPDYFTLRLVTTTLAGTDFKEQLLMLYNYWREKLAVATYQGWDDKPCYGVLSLHWMTYASNIVFPL